MRPYLLVAGDFVESGGMDAANHALATFLARQGAEVHLVTHRAAEALAEHPNVTVHQVPKPLGSYLLGEPLLNHVGRYWASRIESRGGRVLVNGGNCQWGDINWVHYVHSAYSPTTSGSGLRLLKHQWAHRRFVREERKALQRANVVITNSERTKRDLVEQLSVPGQRIHTVYYGTDPDRFHPPTQEERCAIREKLGWSADQPIVVFIGALGDRRKGFDTLFAAWQALCADPIWDATLVVIGTGAELPGWTAHAVNAGLDSRIRFLGFRTDVPQLLAACDALVAPTRYEAYGLAVQEALCCGIPALVTQTAGVAERYPTELHDLLVPDPDNVGTLVARLRAWRDNQPEFQRKVAAFSVELRSHTWSQMASQIVSRCDHST